MISAAVPERVFLVHPRINQRPAGGREANQEAAQGW